MNKLTIAIEFNSKRFILQAQWPNIGRAIQRKISEVAMSMAMVLIPIGVAA